ncbi:hypothetical protein B0T18DRAFT_196932 [Schizothecium vesticola]|uniref:Uncharacterized protein n=1 Tax=Schizothecium vesticola TaxID=314040 RepID=A0AA40K328_9PEZI|nr:hypothetical protein B0T18DRAFT_196932 [Schizothecium vesticola]
MLRSRFTPIHSGKKEAKGHVACVPWTFSSALLMDSEKALCTPRRGVRRGERRGSRLELQRGEPGAGVVSGLELGHQAVASQEHREEDVREGRSRPGALHPRRLPLAMPFVTCHFSPIDAHLRQPWQLPVTNGASGAGDAPVCKSTRKRVCLGRNQYSPYMTKCLLRLIGPSCSLQQGGGSGRRSRDHRPGFSTWRACPGDHRGRCGMIRQGGGCRRCPWG